MKMSYWDRLKANANKDKMEEDAMMQAVDDAQAALEIQINAQQSKVLTANGELKKARRALEKAEKRLETAKGAMPLDLYEITESRNEITMAKHTVGKKQKGKNEADEDKLFFEELETELFIPEAAPTE